MDPFIGEIRAFGFDYPPQDWMYCDGNVYNISQFQALAALLGNNFGGDGRTTFGVPDLRGRVAVGVGDGPGLPYFPYAKGGGSATTLLTLSQVGAHTHNATYQPAQTGAPQVTVAVCTDASKSLQQSPANNILACGMIPGGRSSTPFNGYTTAPTAGSLLAGTSMTGGYLAGKVTVSSAGTPAVNPLNTLGPVLPFNFCICWNGEWPQNPN